jgi:DNA-directed RNA polymerase sigma subunit (sigma70/sigma32)
MVEKTLVEQQEDIQEKIEKAIQKRLSINLQKRVKEKINNHINETIEQAINENHKALTFNILGEFDKKIDEEFLQKYAERNNNNLTVKNDNEVKLSKIEKRVLEMRFELCDNKTQTLEEIGTDIGCTRERIRQLQKNAIQKLVNMYKNNFVSNLTNNKVELFEIEKRILKMRSGLDGDKVMSLTKVERIIGCTHKQIKQHQKNAIQKLMKMYKNNNQPEEKK